MPQSRRGSPSNSGGCGFHSHEGRGRYRKRSRSGSPCAAGRGNSKRMAQFMQKGSSTYERSQRSVFVGNISYDVTEDQIKQVFSKAGQIVHFRLVHDRDTGRPKGFGFCEFTDPSTAATAIRIFNGHELNGRPLRVDSAASSERNMEEAMAQQLQAAVQASRDPAPRPVEESPYGKEPEGGRAPEAIAKTISAMPPEQMFELMKQMKHNVITDPTQTRRLLMENPQLAYALLQAQVVMRIVDPKVAYSMLHREVPAVQQPFHQQQDVQQSFNRPPPPVQQPVFAQQAAVFSASEWNYLYEVLKARHRKSG